MRSGLRNLTILLVLSLAVAACSEAGTAQEQEAQPPASSQAANSAPAMEGEVLETMDSGGYTYVRIQAGKEDFWAAGPPIAVQIGDHIAVVGAMEMRDFHSTTLDRTFDSLWFAGNLVKPGETAPVAGSEGGAAHLGPTTGGATQATLMVEAGSIPKAKDGYSVAEVFAKRETLSTQLVAVRGKVVKFNAQIMGRNWLHVQDGTGGPGENDLTVTTVAGAKVGDTVLIRGVLVLDKDFGAGYKYDVILEDAKVTVED